MNIIIKQNIPNSKLIIKCLNMYLSNNFNLFNYTKITSISRINNKQMRISEYIIKAHRINVNKVDL